MPNVPDSQCQFLDKKNPGVIGQQIMADLPRNGVLPVEPAFTICGVDCFGPFEIKRGLQLKAMVSSLLAWPVELFA